MQKIGLNMNFSNYQEHYRTITPNSNHKSANGFLVTTIFDITVPHNLLRDFSRERSKKRIPFICETNPFFMPALRKKYPTYNVVPAKAGIHIGLFMINNLTFIDSRLRGNDNLIYDIRNEAICRRTRTYANH
jgi:hypothetical protein